MSDRVDIAETEDAPAPPGPAWSTALGTLQFLAAQAIALLLGFAISVVLTRALGPELYGLYSVAVVIINWIDLSLASLFHGPSIKFVAEAERWHEMASALVQAEGVLSAIVALLLISLATPFAQLLRAPTLAPYLRLLALSLPITGLSRAHRSALIAQGAFGRSILPALAYWPVRLLLALFLLHRGLSVWAGVWALVAASMVELLVTRLFVRPSLLQRFHFPLRRFWAYSLPLSLNSMSIRLVTRVDLLLVQALAGAAATGFYGAAQNLSLIPLGFLGSALSSPLLSTLSRLGNEQRTEEAQAIVRNALRFLLCLLPFAALVAGGAGQIVRLLYGPAFLPTAGMLAWLIIGALALTVIGVCSSLLTAAGRPGLTLPLTAPLLPVAVIGHYLLIPKFGAAAAAAVTSMAAILGSLACLVVVMDIWGVQLPLATALRSLVLSAFAYVVAALWPAQGALLLLKLAFLATLLALAFVLLGELTRAEMEQLRSSLRHQFGPRHA